jgi:hypothetical protein
VADCGHATGPVVVKFPDEFDFGNAGDVAERLDAAITPEVSDDPSSRPPTLTDSTSTSDALVPRMMTCEPGFRAKRPVPRYAHDERSGIQSLDPP